MERPRFEWRNQNLHIFINLIFCYSRNGLIASYLPEQSVDPPVPTKISLTLLEGDFRPLNDQMRSSAESALIYFTFHFRRLIRLAAMFSGWKHPPKRLGKSKVSEGWSTLWVFTYWQYQQIARLLSTEKSQKDVCVFWHRNNPRKHCEWFLMAAKILDWKENRSSLVSVVLKIQI